MATVQYRTKVKCRYKRYYDADEIVEVEEGEKVPKYFERISPEPAAEEEAPKKAGKAKSKSKDEPVPPGDLGLGDLG